MTTHGVVYVHSCPAAVCPHVEWAISGVLNIRVNLTWTDQPAAPGTLRAECSWTGEAGTAAKIASALRSWSLLRFEVTEDASEGVDGERISYVPDRGVFRTAISANGDVVVTEQRLRRLLATSATTDDFERGLNELLGAAWDADLEAFRHAGDGAQIRWLHQVV